MLLVIGIDGYVPFVVSLRKWQWLPRTRVIVTTIQVGIWHSLLERVRDLFVLVVQSHSLGLRSMKL